MRIALSLQFWNESAVTPESPRQERVSRLRGGSSPFQERKEYSHPQKFWR